MKNYTLILLCLLLGSATFAQKGKNNTFIGFQTGVVAPLSFGDYSVSKYKIGLPSFSYSASIENRFTINNKLNFSLQYSLTYFNIMQKNQEYGCFNTPSNGQNDEFAASINLNTIYKFKRDAGIIGGVCISNPINQTNAGENTTYSETPVAASTKKTPVFNPFFIIGLENSTKLFHKSLIYSLQYNIGFMPYRNLPLQKNSNASANQYMQGVNIGLKYKY